MVSSSASSWSVERRRNSWSVRSIFFLAVLGGIHIIEEGIGKFTDLGVVHLVIFITEMLIHDPLVAGIVQRIGSRLVVCARYCISHRTPSLDRHRIPCHRAGADLVLSLSIHRFLGTISSRALRSLYDPSTDGNTNAISKRDFP